ncbi:hypothetical protein J8273_2766 [Carpediemonas membranifera]|uniref:Uncharacterized protein n=1 Tax=Carpediemonas membranifera TaxID=201153 RepID=A0A8J6B7H3_9EUKA|nr:hypothetical protein J8273_2766 [Carpediemonas membranifera]|eukprot:KAG9395854.1 hypothetical protein J8273_2766 [Carpediemonas membranifera]
MSSSAFATWTKAKWTKEKNIPVTYVDTTSFVANAEKAFCESQTEEYWSTINLLQANEDMFEFIQTAIKRLSSLMQLVLVVSEFSAEFAPGSSTQTLDEWISKGSPVKDTLIPLTDRVVGHFMAHRSIAIIAAPQTIPNTITLIAQGTLTMERVNGSLRKGIAPAPAAPTMIISYDPAPEFADANLPIMAPDMADLVKEGALTSFTYQRSVSIIAPLTYLDLSHARVARFVTTTVKAGVVPVEVLKALTTHPMPCADALTPVSPAVLDISKEFGTIAECFDSLARLLPGATGHDLASFYQQHQCGPTGTDGIEYSSARFDSPLAGIRPHAVLAPPGPDVPSLTAVLSGTRMPVAVEHIPQTLCPRATSTSTWAAVVGALGTVTHPAVPIVVKALLDIVAHGSQTPSLYVDPSAATDGAVLRERVTPTPRSRAVEVLMAQSAILANAQNCGIVSESTVHPLWDTEDDTVDVAWAIGVGLAQELEVRKKEQAAAKAAERVATAGINDKPQPQKAKPDANKTRPAPVEAARPSPDTVARALVETGLCVKARWSSNWRITKPAGAPMVFTTLSTPLSTFSQLIGALAPLYEPAPRRILVVSGSKRSKSSLSGIQQCAVDLKYTSSTDASKDVAITVIAPPALLADPALADKYGVVLVTVDLQKSRDGSLDLLASIKCNNLIVIVTGIPMRPEKKAEKTESPPNPVPASTPPPRPPPARST